MLLRKLRHLCERFSDPLGLVALPAVSLLALPVALPPSSALKASRPLWSRVSVLT